MNKRKYIKPCFCIVELLCNQPILVVGSEMIPTPNGEKVNYNDIEEVNDSIWDR